MAAAGAYIELEADARLHLAEVLAFAGRREEELQTLQEAAALYDRKGDLTMSRVANDRLAEIVSRS